MTLFTTKPACWAPGLDGEDDWKAWAEQRRAIERSDSLPPLAFTPPLFRRRLSQLSRMTVQVVHDALELAGLGSSVDRAAAAEGRAVAAGEGAAAAGDRAALGIAALKQTFVSFRGELSRQLSINRTLIGEHDVLPASFSLSVFNTPMALASMACHLKGGYSVLFPAADSFYDGFLTACAPLLCGDEEQILFVYADELVPSEYAAFCPADADPLAFAFLLSARPFEGGSLQVDGPTLSFELSDLAGKAPSSFLRMLLKGVYGG